MELIKGKLADIVQHCIYEIATGKWAPGLKLPSVRDAEKLWGVNRLTVLSAYRELEKIGLVVPKDRSGYYVSEGAISEVGDQGLGQLYHQVKELIGRHADFDLSSVLRYFSGMAISEARSKPTYAFLECTLQQAEDHASEIFQKLNVFIAPVRIDRHSAPKTKIPESAQTLFTTGFHINEVKKIGKLLNKDVVNIPIEVDPDPFSKALLNKKKAVLVELEHNMSSNISEDIKRLLGKIKLRQIIIKDVDKDIFGIVDNSDNELILLSPRVWGRCPGKIKQNARVRQIRFKISNASWKLIYAALKIPFQMGRTEFVAERSH
ncbi:MAG: GntR family transcriptional regulator [Aurantibacter sp.]